MIGNGPGFERRSASRSKKLNHYPETVRPHSHSLVDRARAWRIDAPLAKCGVQVQILAGSFQSVIGKTTLILLVAIVYNLQSHKTSILCNDEKMASCNPRGDCRQWGDFEGKSLIHGRYRHNQPFGVKDRLGETDREFRLRYVV